MSEKDKKKKPKLESKEEPVINYGTPPEQPKENIGLSKLSFDEQKNNWQKIPLLKDLKGNVDPNAAKLFESELSYNSEDEIYVNDRVLELEREAEFAKDSYNKLFKKYTELVNNFTELKTAHQELVNKPKVETPVTLITDPIIQQEYDNLKTVVTTMYQEFQNELSGRNARREVHDIIYLSGDFGLISKFRKAFSFLR